MNKENTNKRLAGLGMGTQVFPPSQLPLHDNQFGNFALVLDVISLSTSDTN